MNVSGRLVDRAAVVLEKGSKDLIAKVEAGEVSVSRAASVAKSEPKGEQVTALKSTKKTNKASVLDRLKKDWAKATQKREGRNCGMDCGGLPADRIRGAAMNPKVEQAAAALLDIINDGRELELREWIASARREFNADVHRRWRRNNPIGAVKVVGGLLAKLTDLPEMECENAVAANVGEISWPEVALREILKFAEHLKNDGKNAITAKAGIRKSPEKPRMMRRRIVA